METNRQEEQATETARRLTLALGSSVFFKYSRPSELGKVFLADVESAVEDLHYALMWARNFGGGLPCISFDDQGFVPIVFPSPLAGFARIKDLRVLGRFFRNSRKYFLEHIIDPNLLKVGTIDWQSPLEIPALVLPLLIQYLTVRFKWYADNPEFLSLGAASASQAHNPYLPFTVKANTKGLRIHYSKNFAFSFNNVFGAPTSPVDGWILPGIHKFMGMDSSGNTYYDKGSFTTPPDFEAPLLI
jgi:hypothetical protein